MTAKLEKEIAGLSVGEKRRLIDELWQQLDESLADDEIDSELLKELERRADAYDANPSGGLSLEQIEGKLFGGKLPGGK